MTAIAARVRSIAVSDPTRLFSTFVVGESAAERITFSQLFQSGCGYAHEYRSRGVKPGEVVIIILRHSPHLFYSFVGALLAGAIPSFMPHPSRKQHPDVYWHDHQTLFDRIAPRLIVTYEENAEAVRAAIANFSIDMLIADDALLVGQWDTDGLPGLASRPSDLACLQHSSGTTGLKKGIMLSHRAIIDQVSAYSRALRLGRGDRLVSWLPLYHDMGFIACFMMPLIEGLEVVALDPFEWVMRPQILLEAIERYKATLCWLPNFAFSHVVNGVRPSAVFDLSSVRAFINCSEPCKPMTFDRFIKRFESSGVEADRLHVCYAMAENVFAVTQSAVDRAVPTIRVDADAFARGHLALTTDPAGYQLLSCGSAIEGVRIDVRGPCGDPVPAGNIGEIWIASPYLFEGYYLQPDVTARKLQDGWYSTGDMGVFHDGELYVTGRLDDMLVVNGRNFYAHEIEALFNDVDGLLPGRSIALGIDDERTDATVVVLLAERSHPHADRERIVRDVRNRSLQRLGLSIHSVMLLEPGSLIKTTSGKLSRLKNKDLYLEQIATSAHEGVRS